VDGLHADLQQLHEAGQAGRLARRQLQHQPAERGGVHHRVLERAAQPAAEDPGVEGVVAVLDQHRAAREVEEAAARVAELRRVHQHLAIDQVPALGVGVDRRPRVDQGVEEAQRAAEPEALGADLEDQEGPVAGGLDVDRDVLGLVERSLRADRGEVRLRPRRLPDDQLRRPPGFQPERAAGSVLHGLHRKINSPPCPLAKGS